MKENQPYYDKGSHWLRGQTHKILDRFEKQGLPIVKSELIFSQRRQMNRPTSSGKK